MNVDNEEGKNRFSEIMNSIRKDKPDVFDELVSDATIHYKTIEDGWNWLHLALLGIQTPTVRIVNHLIARGVDVNGVDACGYTPLHLAAKCKSAQLISALIQSGANIEAERKPGLTPIRETLLAKPFDIESIQTFIKYGANINSAPPGGKSVIELATILSHGNDKDLLQIFL